jgi:hypothetical protein
VHQLTSAPGRDAGVMPDASHVRSARSRPVGRERALWGNGSAWASPEVGGDRDRIAQGLNDIVVRRLFPAGLSLQAALGLQANTACPERSATLSTNWTRPSAISAAPSSTSHFFTGTELPDRARQRVDGGALQRLGIRVACDEEVDGCPDPLQLTAVSFCSAGGDQDRAAGSWPDPRSDANGPSVTLRSLR